MQSSVKKHCCGFYKGLKIFQVGQMIGNSWYGHFYAAKKRNKRYIKIEGSKCDTLEEITQKIKTGVLK